MLFFCNLRVASKRQVATLWRILASQSRTLVRN
jgi:hypothetical protein